MAPHKHTRTIIFQPASNGTMAYSGLLPLLLIAAAAPLASAIEITVGDDLGWTDYTCYRPITNVRVGDTLFFKATGAHDVFKMTSEENLDACDFMGGERIARAGSDAEYIVNEEDAAAGGVYFTCTIGVHCEKHFQRLKVEVVDRERGRPSGSEYVTGGAIESQFGTPYDEVCDMYEGVSTAAPGGGGTRPVTPSTPAPTPRRRGRRRHLRRRGRGGQRHRRVRDPRRP